MSGFNELVSKKAVLEVIREEMPINRMDTDEEVAMERLYHRIVARVEAVETKSERLSVEELKKIDAPVWCKCETFDGEGGYWCICKDGVIIAPSGRIFAVEEIPKWNFYRYRTEAEYESELQREMKKRKMTEADILEYIKFEDDCVLKGYTLKSLLEAREKQDAKKPYWALDKNREPVWVNCPCCQQRVTIGKKHCSTCGQKLDWSRKVE